MSNSNYQRAKEVIDSLNAGNFYCECPCGCGEEIRLRDAGLFYLDELTDDALEALNDLKEQLKDERMKLRKKKERKASHTQSVNFGFISEKIATALSTFPFEHNDCRSLFKPIDYIIFEGLSRKGTVTKLIFSEIKSGGARLNEHQKQVKQVVESKKVDLKIY